MPKQRKRFLLVFLCGLLFPPSSLFAQEAIKSVEEMYFNFLVLRGLAQRPYLNFRTLSDSVWDIDADLEHPWHSQRFGTFHPMFGDFRVRIYGPELFMSVNTIAPFGQNDGVLWQGRGFNTMFRGGIRIEGHGLELTLLPHFAFSQNAHFDIMPSPFESEFGYFWGYGVDAPQRFGDRPFFDWDFGDSEIRYTWRTLTIGFGTQAIWLGPSYLHSILHSNNAPAYPRFDIGLRRQRIILPWLGWDIGEMEARLWVGRLTKSDFFDSDGSNLRGIPSFDHTMFHGLALAYAPSFLPGLTLFANRVALVPWAWENLSFIIPNTDNTFEDQKASFGFSWLFPQVGFEVYGEVGIDDYTVWIAGHPRWTGYLRNLYHTMVFTLGTRKALTISERRNIFGQFVFEWSHMEMSQTFQFQWPYSFYFHHELIHGYTNRGQWLGNGFSPGGNAQYFEFRLFYPRGTSSFFIHRYNPDNNFIYKFAIRNQDPDDSWLGRFIWGFRANLAVGVTTHHRISENLGIGGKLAYNFILNPFYLHNRAQVYDEEMRHNFHFSLTIRYAF